MLGHKEADVGNEQGKESGEGILKALEVTDAATHLLGEKIGAFEHVAEKFGPFTAAAVVAYHTAAAGIDALHGEGKGTADHLLSVSIALVSVAVPEIGFTQLGYDGVAAAARAHGIPVPTADHAVHAGAIAVAEGAANAAFRVMNPEAPLPGQPGELHHGGDQPGNAAHDAAAASISTSDHSQSDGHGATDHVHTENVGGSDLGNADNLHSPDHIHSDGGM